MDRLPDSLLHRIMSLISFAEAVRVGILSRKYLAAFRSFPILEIDFDSKRHRNVDYFYRVIYVNLRNRPKNVLERLSIRCHFNSMFNPLGPDLIFLAASYNLRELELQNTDVEFRDNHKDGRYYSITLPGGIFHLKTLAVLKLDCFQFETANIVLDHVSALKKLRLERTLGIRTLSLKNNTSLEYLEIANCEDMQFVDLDASKLEHFEFIGPYSVRKCDVAISPHTKALKTLRLMHANVSKSLFQEITPTGKTVENLFLKLSKTMELKWIQLDWPKLKKVEFMGMLHLEKIDLLAENLESCILDMSWSPTCELNFREPTGRFLKTLSLLYSEKITGTWIEQNLGWFCLLENFRVEGCNKLKWVKFTHDRIKNLKLLRCRTLDKVEIDTPLLESFEMDFSDKVPPVTLIRSNPLSVKLSLSFSTSKPVPYEKLNCFLIHFNRCKELTLNLKSKFDHMFPPIRRGDGISITPLLNVKNLKFDIRYEEDMRRDDSFSFTNLLKFLFWLVPRPNCITFITSRKKDPSIKFEYGYLDLEEVHPCCLCHPELCWKHKLVSVYLSNFDDTYPRSVANKKELLDFLRENASRLKNIYDDGEIEVQAAENGS